MMTDVLVLDLSSLRYQWDADRRFLTAFTSAGEVLAVADAGDLSDREAVFAACDLALAEGSLLRADRTGELSALPIALLNPYTLEVAVGAVPNTEVFSTSHEFFREEGEWVASRRADGEGAGEYLEVGGHRFERWEPSFASLTRSLTAHQG